MASRSFKAILKRWERRLSDNKELESVDILLRRSDSEKIQALADVYQVSAADITAELLHEALQQIEIAMPYIPGDNVIRIEEGEAIYDDAGPTPKYMAALKNIATQAKANTIARRKILHIVQFFGSAA